MLFSVEAALADPCETEHQFVLGALEAAKLPEGTHQKIATKVENAWRIFSSASTQSVKNAASQLDQAKKLLDGAAAKNVPAELRIALSSAIDAFSACIGSSSVPTAPLTVRVSLAATAAGASPTPAGAGATLRVDDIIAGTTKTGGTATINVPLGIHRLTAELLPDWKGVARNLAVAESGNAPVDIIMETGADLSLAAELQFAEVADGLLPRDFSAANLQLVDDDGKTVRLRRVDTIELRSEADLLDVTKMFTLRPDGSLSLSAVGPFRTEVLDRYDPLRLAVHAFDDKGLSYRGATQFAVGRFRTSGSVSAPPGVTLNRGSIQLNVVTQKLSLSFWSVTSPDGKADFPPLPQGHYLYSCDTVQNNTRYFARGGFELDSDGKSFDVPLFSIQTPTNSAGAATKSAVTERRAAAAAAEKPQQWFYQDKHGKSHPMGEPSGEEQKIISITFRYTAEGTLRPILFQDVVWPEHLVSVTEAELLAARKADDASDTPHDRRVINARLFDERGNVVFRVNVPIDFVTTLEGVRAAVAKPFITVDVPALQAYRLELTGWDARQTSTFDLRTLATDERLRSGELLTQ
jgi:hypothetical protein